MTQTWVCVSWLANKWNILFCTDGIGGVDEVMAFLRITKDKEVGKGF